MRLDHLLSKEHHEKHPPLVGVWAVRSRSPVVGGGWVHNNKSCRFDDSGIAGTLLGPEATPGPVMVGVVAPSWWWGVVFGNWIVVASIR